MSARVVVLLWLSLFFLLGDSVVLHNSALLAKTRDPNAAPTVVLLHGLLGSSRNFGAFARILYEKLGSEHNIVAIDARNHGRSVALGPMPIAYELMSEDVTGESQEVESSPRYHDVYMCGSHHYLYVYIFYTHII